MKLSGVIQATVIGNFSYNLIKSKEKMTAERLLSDIETFNIDWCYDEETTVSIANRLNELGNVDEEDIEEYNERLNSDIQLTDLLERASPVEVKDIGQVVKLPEKPPNLLGREQNLNELMDAIDCDEPYCDILVRGMGGVGKTVICRSLAYRCNESATINDILWINAHNGLESYLRGKIAPDYEIDVLHPDWLKHLIAQLACSASPSVMFFDNLEDDEQDTEIFNQLAQLDWHIIATSRHVLKQFGKIYTIEVLNVAQCIELFQRHYGQLVRPKALPTLKALIKLAGQHTLTVELLGKIAKEDELSVENLYKQVVDSGFDLSKITTKRIDAKYNAIELRKTRQFELHDHLSKLFNLVEIEEKDRIVLRVLAVLPYQPYEGKTQLRVWMSLKGINLLVRLENKAWLQASDTKYFMHPVIGHVARTDLPLHLGYLQMVGAKFNHTIQPKSNERWIEKVVYVPHLLAITYHLKQESIELSDLLFSLACIYQAKSDYANAEALFLQVLKMKENLHGAGNAKLLNVVNSLASLKKSTNELDEALKYNLHSLTISQKSLGSKHLVTSVSMGNLANLYKLKGNYTKALEFYSKALAINEAQLEPTHPHVTMTLNRVAHLLKSMGRHADALPLYQKTLAIRERTLGPEHVSVAAALNHLGMLYQSLNELNQALELYRRSLSINQKIFGPDSVEVAAVLNNIAILFMSFGKADKALPYFMQTLKIRENVYGPNHSKLVAVLNSIAKVHEKNEELYDAVDFYLRSLKINERFNGAGHPKVTAILNNLARILVRRTNEYWSEAEFWRHCNEREVFHSATKNTEIAGQHDQNLEMTFHPEHPCIGHAFYLEGKKYKGSFQKSLKLHQQGLALRQKVLPQNDPEIMASLEAVGDTYYANGDRNNSILYYEQTVDVLTAKLGPTHVEIGKFLAKIAFLYQLQSKHEVAKSMFDRSIDILRDELGDKDLLTVETVRKRITLIKIMELR